MKKKTTPIEIEKDDIQGLLIRGYAHLNQARFLLLHFEDLNAANSFLHQLTQQITSASAEKGPSAVNLAFTYSGLKYLNLPKELLESFSRQFKEGMNEETRQIILGDIAANNPGAWDWTDAGTKALPGFVSHAVLLLYAEDESAMNNLLQLNKARCRDHQVEIYELPPSDGRTGVKEHFGFRDGISQPTIKGISNRLDDNADNEINAGEFILGYKNEYDQIPDSPYVFSVGDPKNILPEIKTEQGSKDFGRNGSYLVFRQMSQDVHGFWNYMKNNTAEKGENGDQRAIHLAAKAVGRWPNGTPVTLHPDKPVPDITHDDREKLKTDEEKGQQDPLYNNFGYFKKDLSGTGCPIGAHVRRTNPRDYLVTVKNNNANDSVLDVSTAMVKKHRLLRRGRAYGDPLVPSMNPEELMHKHDDGKERGIHFICFAGDLVRQFEFVQNAWVKFHKFGGLYNESDPLIGTRNIPDDAQKISADEFTVPDDPVRRRYKNLAQFTLMKGGAYFFFPGIKALRYLSSLRN